ncbi:MAG: AraC family transcriptional regulator [Bacteroidota bacterium]
MSQRSDLADFMEQNFLRNVPLADLAKESGRSLSTFNRECKQIFKETPHRWIMKRRLEFARGILLTTDKKISEIYFLAGFQDFTHFGKAFKKMFGLCPSAYRDQMKN